MAELTPDWSVSKAREIYTKVLLGEQMTQNLDIDLPHRRQVVDEIAREFRAIWDKASPGIVLDGPRHPLDM